MHVSAIPSVRMGGSSVVGKVAGLGRDAMIANFIEMVDEWLDMLREQNGESSSTAGASSTLPVDPLIPASPFYTYKRDKGGHFSVQKVAAADIAATMLLAIA